MYVVVVFFGKTPFANIANERLRAVVDSIMDVQFDFCFETLRALFTRKSLLRMSLHVPLHLFPPDELLAADAA